MIKLIFNLAFLIFVQFSYSLPIFEGVGEREDWLGTYFHGKKMGFTKSKIRWGPEGILLDSTVFFKIRSKSIDQSTTIKQTTRLRPNFKLSSFSLLQEISGKRQQVEGKMEGNELFFRKKSLGYDKEKTLKFTEKTFPSSILLINLISAGLKVGQRDELKLFMEPLQMLVDFEYEVLKEEKLQYEGNLIDTFVIRQRFSSMESTIWVANDGTVYRESTNLGFESFKEEPQVAQKIEEGMTVSSVITMSLVKPNKPVPHPKKTFDLVYKINHVSSNEAIPEDHRQKIIKNEKRGEGSYTTTLRVKSEALKTKFREQKKDNL